MKKIFLLFFLTQVFLAEAQTADGYVDHGFVHPCVEINFRRTMGLLALALYNKGITDNQLLAGNPRQGFSAQIIDGKLGLRFNIEN